MEESKNQIVRWSAAKEDYVIEGIFYLLLRQNQKRDKKLEVQLFLVRLLVLLSFASLPCFYLVLEVSTLGLTIGLAIGEVEFISGEIIISFSEWLRWKVLMSLQRCNTAIIGFQVLSSLG